MCPACSLGGNATTSTFSTALLISSDCGNSPTRAISPSINGNSDRKALKARPAAWSEAWLAKYAMTMLSGGRRRQALHFCVVAIIGGTGLDCPVPRPLLRV
jgi:hypothetical protein